MKKAIENFALRYQAFINPEFLVPVAVILFGVGMFFHQFLL